ncbi:MAG TPA: histidine--tRNA ligase [Cyclobacteriaceae bacterium]|nr:histidine--tRNA ligase [Cyclobacteriaceae bacterium]HMV90522.1 histidine--tRNA ligase [Cyclobacteriaceae bacterium]HMX00134.1 histidine--tRNA ligase [Cyclobacteriaceae bacterium]HMX52197.1 histidine--tRNA ligase [Cyclobacteriaceae bacterium]HMY92954.1 histidine--tRNA ligase [Cyclobacteriaceae bacterium]
MEKPTLPKGTRDFGPAVMAKRQFILDAIRRVFQKFGFQPLETPAMENLSTLTGKYGEEGDQLLFKILDSGDFYKKIFSPLTNRSIENKLKDLFSRVSLRIEKVADLKNLINDILKELEFEAKEYDDRQSLIIIKDYVKADTEFVQHEIVKFLTSREKTGDSKKDVQSLLLQIPNLVETIFYNLNGFETQRLKPRSSKQLQAYISEKGLRYDLTVPFARYVVMNKHDIPTPFKRYQIQPVWRADRPQKGRYREFYQCDADVVGTDSLTCEAEIILMIREVFQSLKIEDYTIKINHRGVLTGLAELAGAKENQTSLFVAIDKLDKIGEEKVKEELLGKGFTEKSIKTVFDILNFQGTTSQKVVFLNDKFTKSEAGDRGVSQLSAVLRLLRDYNSDDKHVEFDIALARGLSYYTGCIFEVKINNVSIGSVSGGGRYDNLTAAFGDKENLSGVGFSFGVDRLYDAMEELNLFPKEAQASTKILICHFDEETQRFGLKELSALRAAGIAAEVYPDQAKMKKQLDYANKKMIPYAIVIGSEETKNGFLTFKNMETGDQEKLTVQQIIQKLKA